MLQLSAGVMSTIIIIIINNLQDRGPEPTVNTDARWKVIKWPKYIIFMNFSNNYISCVVKVPSCSPGILTYTI